MTQLKSPDATVGANQPMPLDPLPVVVHFVRPYKHVIQVDPQCVQDACNAHTCPVCFCINILHTHGLASDSISSPSNKN